MADRLNRVGQQLGNYRLIGLLGQGGFAEVYLGEHIHLGTQAAVKVLHTQLTNEHVEAFRTEARTIAHLIHPHIVRVLEFGVEEGIPFLVMDYAPNGTLRKLHPKGSSLAIATIVTYGKQIADALQYAHDEKLIHRDIKPENMLVGRHHEILLSDFGIALVAQSSRYQSTQDVIGTVVYMSPEQIQGKPRPASDQYALGIVVYEWLCGDRPFHGSFTELCAQHMFAPPPPLREKVPTVSPDVEQVVITALAKDPHQRFASVQAFATALEQASQLAQGQPAISPRAVPSLSEGFSSTIVTTPPNPSPESLISISPTNLPSPFEQKSQSKQHLPALSLSPGATPPPQPLPPMVPVAPSHRRRELTTQDSPASSASLAPEVSDTQEPMLQPTNHLSRRTVIVGLGGLTLVGSGITWFVASRSSASKPTLRMIPTTLSTPATLPIGTMLFTYKGHSAWVDSVAWSLNGLRIASASWDKTVQVWGATDGSNAFTYTGHSDAVHSVAWSPDGLRIASASSDKTVQVWDATDGSHVLTYTGHSAAVDSVARSRDGKRIASGSDDKTVQVWDATDSNHVFTYTGHSSGVRSVAWSPNGKRIASASWDKTVQVWDASNGSNIFTYNGHSSYVDSVAWSPDGKRIASGSGDTTVQVWDATDGSNVFTYKGHFNPVWSVAWSPDGKRIASASFDKTVQVWDATDGSHVFTYAGHSDWVLSVAWSPDGKHIASSSRDKTAQVWVAS